ncbi:SRPBCC family protein [Streptomyces boninensis]|uniref:type II toxin-antitoxin system Rv0910 family toxin n=1 Tax=Streptomyces boninensis TaxID=2039455 RepID=UPI003B21A104
MTDISAEARIEAAADKVWAKLTDFSVYGDWSVTHTGFPKGVPGDLKEGDSFSEGMKLMGFPAEAVWTVEELAEGSTIALAGKGPMGVKMTTRYTVTPDGDASTVRIDGSFSGGAVAMMAGKLKESGNAALKESLEKLNGLVVG